MAVCIDTANNGLCVDWRGVDATFIPQLDNMGSTSLALVSNQEDGHATEGNQPLTHRQPVDGVPSVRVKVFLHVLMLVHLIIKVVRRLIRVLIESN